MTKDEQIAKLKSEKDTLRTIGEALTKAVNDADRKLAKLKEEGVKMHKHILEQRAEAEKLKASEEKWHKQCMSVTHKLNEACDIIEKHQVRKAELEKENNGYYIGVRSLEKKIKHIEKKLATIRKQVEGLGIKEFLLMNTDDWEVRDKNDDIIIEDSVECIIKLFKRKVLAIIKEVEK